ncbi:ABC transporter substrate-binding protein [Anaerocolumna xylanovorans]|uniref:Raffinose/stachyose/melibiose transport system substrate-binding protein n=1 Tax=Anaerocolumna xylanovorans DSM 12503 TaxID=1121345 RepID=A0A1M7YCK1_9FIRM|nr:extracellular solute-binding protein [Anaerocolumna xylanovorans]SHO50364.1 raffinose/stachyose/melibiose transport system substrate-binding protein [Anaerocolumna xylanovorans DSM 12503]
MKKRLISLLMVFTMVTALLTGCGGKTDNTGSGGSDSGKNPSKSSEEKTVVKWLASRPVDGAIDLTMREIAKQYSEEHGGNWELQVETTADRPSYLQKLKTLIAGNNMPDIIDIDADPYCKELVDAGMLVDVKSFLKDEGKYDDFYPIALKYQEFTDGSMYTLPLEYHVEMIWYNKEIFAANKVEVPKTVDEWLDVCAKLKANGITPISVDGVDRWPVQRYLAMLPFRDTGNDYIINLRDGKASMGDETGMKSIKFLQQMGQYFNEGFAATDYATAQSLFLDGKSAMYYIGDWEQAAMLEQYEAGKVDYFYLPTTPDGKTGANEFCVNSGIGMAFNTKTFDEKTKDFILYVIDNYGKIYAGRQQMSPIKTELPKDIKFTDLYLRIQKDMNNTGEHFLKPWDTYLDSGTNAIMQDNMLLVASGDMSAEDFIKLVDDSIAVNKQ